jgi:EAL domain-containing protein (putative c-di-GMP-specific phosphodiesterase class I)
MNDLLESMLADASLWIVFQPIFDIRSGAPEPWAMEALTRGPMGTHFESASVLFDYVRLKRDEVRVDRHCCANAIRAAAGVDASRIVTINAHASTLERDPSFASFVLETCEASRLAPNRLIIEIVEHVPYLKAASLKASLSTLRAAGVRFAIDDLGFGHGNLRMFLDVQPEFVKVERYFIGGCAADPARRTLLKAIDNMARDFAARVIAEGVEEPDDLDVLRELGISLAQGFLLGRPSIHYGAGADYETLQNLKEQTCNERRSSVSTTPRPS